MTAKKTEILIIGAGLIGLSTAMHIKRMRPRSTVTVIEKGSVISDQQSGHNSGVLHAGIYYEPGSLKAQFCVEGNQQLAGRKLRIVFVESGLPRIGFAGCDEDDHGSNRAAVEIDGNKLCVY